MARQRRVGCATALVLGVAGMAAGLVWAYTTDQGYFTGWDLLPAPPVPACDLEIDRDEHLVPFLLFKAMDGSHYVFDAARAQWQKAEPTTPFPEAEWTTPSRSVTHPCDHGQPEFSLTAGPPSDLVACVQLAWRFEGTLRETYAVTTDGVVWHWRRDARGMFLPVSYLLGPLLGLVIGVGLARAAAARRRAETLPGEGDADVPPMECRRLSPTRVTRPAS